MTLPTGLVVELRRRRQHLRLRQQDLADRIGISKYALSRWERRISDPGLGALCAWCEELGFNLFLVSASGTRAD